MLNNKRRLLKCLSIISIIIVSIFMLTGCRKKYDNKEVASEQIYLQPLTYYFEGIKNKDLNQMLKAFPDFAKMAEKITADDLNDLYAQYESLYGENVKIDYSVGDAIALSEEEINEVESEISSIYTDVENIDITAGYSVPVKVTITGDGIKGTEENQEETEKTEEIEETEEDNSNVDEEEMYVLQYNGGWYIL